MSDIIITRLPHRSRRCWKAMNHMKTTPNLHRTGFTLIEIMIVVAIIGLLAAIAIPNFVGARARAQANACINNLTKIDAVASEFALENGRKNGDAINYPSDLTPYIKLNRAGSIPGCPAGGVYTRASRGCGTQLFTQQHG